MISLVLGIYQSVGVEHEPLKFGESGCFDEAGCSPPQIEWVEGVAILIAVLIVVMVGSVNDWQKERQFKKLNEKKDDRTINCIRGGVRMSINTKVSSASLDCFYYRVDVLMIRGHPCRTSWSVTFVSSRLVKSCPSMESSSVVTMSSATNPVPPVNPT